MRCILRAWAAFLLALPVLSAQTSPVTVTPTLVSVALGQPLYCAAKWTNPNIQLYCYTSSSGHTWDQLIFNSVFPVMATVTIPDVMNCLPGAPSCTTSATILWIFYPDKTTAGVVDWQVAWNGTGMQKGTFQ